jgi:sulfur carrier protein ThiS
MNFTWPKLVTKVNGQLVWPEDYDKVVLQENDDLKIHHLLGGG